MAVLRVVAGDEVVRSASEERPTYSVGAVPFDLAGELFRERPGLILAHDLVLHRHFPEDADRLVKGRPQLFLLRLA